MLRIIVCYGVLLAVGSIGMQWLQYRWLVRAHPEAAWVALIAVAFMGLGVWVGARLFRRAPASFEINIRVRDTLRISEREFEVLELLAAGQSLRRHSPSQPCTATRGTGWASRSPRCFPSAYSFL